MNRNLLSLTGALVFCLNLGAAILPPEQLLPADTLAVFTVPDTAKATAIRTNDPSWQLWSDPALKPFRDKLVTKLEDEVVKPLERELGIKFADYSGLAQGQWTLAVIQNGWQGKAEPLPAWLVLIDAKDKKGELGLRLAELRKKLVDSGKKPKTEKIRDSEFTTLSLTTNDLPEMFRKVLGAGGDGDDDESAEEKTDKKSEKSETPAEAKSLGITFGQFDSLLIVGDNPKVIEKVLIRQSGGPVAPLQEVPTFQKDYQARFRDSLVYGWVNLKPLIDVLAALAKEQDSHASAANSPVAMPPWSKVLSASGLAGLRSFSFNAKSQPEGELGEINLGVPADERAGFFKILSLESKEAGPAPFVPANVMSFQRYRLDLPKSWAALEKMVTEVFPQAGNVLDLMFQSAGKDKDPNYNLKTELLGNLGDDLISYDLPPRGTTFKDLNSAPGLFLLGSPNPDKLVAAIKAATALFPPPLSSVKEREFQGRKIYSMNLGPMPNPGGGDAGAKETERTFSFAASGGYIAMSTDDATLETYLRSAENPGKPLRDTPGLADAAQRVGGLNTGLFGYQNDAESIRALVEVLRTDSGTLDQILAMTPLGDELKSGDGNGLKDWLDFSLLPPFDRIAKYFGFSVYGASLTADGYSLKFFTPTPPQLKK